jgi:ABC-type transport system involved in cytochrome bd biosynthesis fused ATPase/permease subunit
MPEPSATHDNRPRSGARVLLAITRVWIPAAIAVAGLVAIIVGGGKDDVTAGAGVSLVLVALIVWMINWMFRMSVQSNREREREEEAREYFDRTGRWPDE